MAQSFYGAFGDDGIGTIGNETMICSSDIDGINMIAIQALEKRTQEVKTLKQEINDFKSRLELLEKIILN